MQLNEPIFTVWETETETSIRPVEQWTLQVLRNADASVLYSQ